MTTLPDMIRDLQALLEEKDDLAERTKTNNAAIEAAKEQIALRMVDDDMPEITYKGYSFKLTPKVSYTKKSEADIAAAGVDFFDVLREEGLGDIIVETVNARTLQSTINALVEEAGALPEALEPVIRVYEYNDITRRKKAVARGGRSA